MPSFPTEEMLRSNLAVNLRYLRNMKNPRLSQDTLARKLGVTQKSISKYEQGYCLPSVILLAAMANYFHLDMEDLLYGNLPQKKGRDTTK